jgi:hypothetical protein
MALWKLSQSMHGYRIWGKKGLYSRFCTFVDDMVKNMRL